MISSWIVSPFQSEFIEDISYFILASSLTSFRQIAVQSNLDFGWAKNLGIENEEET